MLKKKTKIIILVAMVALLGVTGYLNIALNNRVVDASSNVSAVGYFDAYRSERSLSRTESIAIYDGIIADSASTQEMIEEATKGKMGIATQMESELALEYSIKGLGYEDAIVTSSKNYINVVVQASELTQTEVAKIVSLIYDQTDYSLSNIKIIPVNV